MLPDLPTSPLPPPEGAFRRVRRRAFLRRMRLPAVALSVAVLAGTSIGAIRPHPTASLEPVGEPSATDTYSPTPSPTTPSPAWTPVPTVSPPPDTVLPTRDDHDAFCGSGKKSAGPNITGTVVDRDGQPMANLAVWTDNCHGVVIATRTDEHGRFSVVCTNAFVTVAPFGWGDEVGIGGEVGFVFLNDRDTFWGRVPCGTDHRVVLPRAAGIRVHLTDGNGHEVPPDDRYLVLFYEREDANPFQATLFSGDGTFDFGALGPGRYLVLDPAHRARVWVTLAEGQLADVDMPTGTTPTSPPPTLPTMPTATPTETPTETPTP